MSKTLHPSAHLPAPVLAAIRHYARQAEQDQRLHDAQLKEIYREKWFKMFVPLSHGGLQFTLPEALRTEEALAWADGSVAWVVTLCSGAGWFVGFLDHVLAEKIFADGRVCLAGSGAVTGTADVHKDGFVVNGEWKYATGSLHATMFTANCMIRDGGTPVLGEDGKPEVKSFIFFRDEVSIERTWTSMGMVATGSHTFRVTNLFVSSNRKFQIAGDHATLPGTVYQYPFLQLAESTLAVNLSGMAQQFLDLVKPVFEKRMAKDPLAKTDLLALHEKVNASLNECRNEFYTVLEKSWSLCEAGNEIPALILDLVSEKSYKLYLTSISQVDTLYRYAGLIAASTETEINRVWRNIHTASQHSLFSQR